MRKYITTKIVDAKPMTNRDFLTRGGKEISDDVQEIHGYLVKYPDGYISWCPRSQFEISSREITPEELFALNGSKSFIVDVDDINTSTKEGKLLIAAIAKITTESQTDKTPIEVIDQIVNLSLDMIDEGSGGQNPDEERPDRD